MNDLQNAPAADTGAVRFRLSPAYAALLSLGLVPAFLALPFASSDLFCGFALMAMAALIFAAARCRVTVLGLIVPAYLCVLFTGAFSVQTVAVGIVFAAGVSAFLIRGRRWIFAAGALILSALLIVLIRGLPYVLLLLGPAAAGAALALLWCREKVSGASAALAAVLTAVFVLLFLADRRLHLVFVPELTGAGDLSQIADTIRSALTERIIASRMRLLGTVDEEAAAVLADTITTSIPALLFSFCSILGFLQHSLITALADTAGLGERIPERSRALTLTPVSAFAFVGACFVYLFTGLGGSSNLASVAALNLILILLCPFCAVGTREITLFFALRLFRAEDPDRCTAAPMLTCALVLITSLFYLVISAFAGLLSTLRPLFRALREKLGPGDDGSDRDD